MTTNPEPPTSPPTSPEAAQFSDRTPLRVVVLISGGGSTLANLIRAADARDLGPTELVGVVSSRGAVRGVEIAREAGLPLVVCGPPDLVDDPDGADRCITRACDAWRADLVLMAGFLRRWLLPPTYLGRVINIHPALLPKFGGKGMYGTHVHEAVLAARERESGCTVHLVDDQYDHGPIVAQRRVAVEANDDAAALAARVQAAERQLYPEIVRAIAQHGLRWLERQARPQQ